MSIVLSGNADRYPLNHDGTQNQSPNNFMNNFSSTQMFPNHQWAHQSPNGSNSTPSPIGAAAQNSTVPQPSPLLNSTNGTPQPIASTIRNPFEEDILNRPAYNPPPPNLKTMFDLFLESRQQFYKFVDPHIRMRLPVAANTIASERISYPVEIQHLLRSQAYPFPKMGPMLGPPMVPQPAAAPPPPAPKRSKKKKQTEAQQQAQLQQQQLQQQQQQQQQAAERHRQMMIHQQMMMQQQSMAMNGMPPQAFGMPMNMPPVDPSRPCSSHDPKSVDSRPSPNAIPPHFKTIGRPPSNDCFVVPMGIPRGSYRPMGNEKCVDQGECQNCHQQISSGRRGIRCTAMGIGCLNTYHLECVGISAEAFQLMCSNVQSEWVCFLCEKKPLIFRG